MVGGVKSLQIFNSTPRLGFRANFFHFKGGIKRWRRTVLLEAVQE
jgi:hypothetical protein